MVTQGSNLRTLRPAFLVGTPLHEAGGQIRLNVKMLAFGEREPATLALILRVPTLIVHGHVYQPGELPKGTKILVPPMTDIPQGDRDASVRLIDAARRQGFEVIPDVQGAIASL